MKNAETEARVGLSVVDTRTGEIKAEAECSLEDFQKLPDMIAEQTGLDRQMALFDGEQVELLHFSCKAFKGIRMATRRPLKLGDEVTLKCRARVVEVKGHRNNELMMLTREHALHVNEAWEI